MKKTLRDHIAYPQEQYSGIQTLTIMLTLLIASLQVFQLQAADTVHKGESITISFQETTLKEALSILELKTPYRFFYNHRAVDASKKVSLQVTNVTIHTAVAELFRNTQVTYKIKGDQIVLKKRRSDTASMLKEPDTDLAEEAISFSLPETVPVSNYVDYELTVAGTILSETGEPLPGVNVVVKGSSVGTVTDADGKYTLNIPDEDAGGILVFSFIGYLTVEEAIGGRTTIDITLTPDIQTLSEVVVIGYGSQEKKDLTGAVSVVNSEDLQKRQATTVAEAMQGLATGVNIRGGGQPGSEAQIQIRGLKSIGGNSNPLYVIDGLITTANRDFNPNDIESIQILKDASAAAIYGSRAANGVIIITTKKGKEGPMQVDISAKSGVQTIPRYDLMETDEFAVNNYMAYDNAGIPRQNLNTSINTDWQDEAFQTGNIQDCNVSFSGGSKSGNYMVSANYFGNKGTVISTDFDRLSLRVNTQGSKGIFTIGENIAISNSIADEMSGNPFYDVVRLLPTIPVRDASNPGGYGYGNEASARTFGTNPVAIADLEDRTNENFRVRGNIWSELDILPYLKYRINIGYETSSDHYKYFRKEGNWTLNQAYDPSIGNEFRARYQSTLVENTLTFDRTFGKHAVNVLAGYTYQGENYERISGTRRNFIRNSAGQYYTVLDAGVTNPETGGYENNSKLLSYLGRINYDFDDKYFLMAVIRRDGTSRVSKDQRWGNFPSVSAGWRISRENFFNVPWINDLKLRANYGTLGSSNIGHYEYIPLINTFPTAVFGKDQVYVSGATQVRLANEDLRWETLTQQNYGFDATFLNNKITLTAEYFTAETEDVLVQMPIALTTGNDGGAPVANAASLLNKGFEFSLTYREENKPFKYFATANFTTLRNEVKSLGYGRDVFYTWMTKTEIGQPIAMFYLLEPNGLFQSQEEINNHINSEGIVIQPDAAPGDIRFIDHNDDGQITGDDRVVISNPWPDFELGINLGASYKGFDLSMTWFSAIGAEVFNGPRSVMDRFDDNSNYRKGVRPWTPENPDTDFPRAYYASTLNSRGDSYRWVEDGSFTRLKFISIGYTLPDALIEKIGLQSCKVSVSGQNLITFTKYLGLDPEFTGPNIFEKGHEAGAFPNTRTVSLGVQLGF